MMDKDRAGLLMRVEFVAADILSRIARPVMFVATELAAGYAVKCGFDCGDPYQIVVGLGGMGGLLLGEKTRRDNNSA